MADHCNFRSGGNERIVPGRHACLVRLYKSHSSDCPIGKDSLFSSIVVFVAASAANRHSVDKKSCEGPSTVNGIAIQLS